MPRCCAFVLLLVVWCSGTPAWAFLASGSTVHDPLNFLQNYTTAWNTAKQYAETVRQIQQDYEVLKNTVTMVSNQAKMLADMPKGLDMLQTITAYGSQADALLSQTQGLSFALGKSTADFERLYRQAAVMTTPHGRLQVQQQMREARMQTTGLAVQVQSIKATMADIYARLSALLSGASIVEGTKAMQQVAAQQRSLLMHSQQSAQAMQAVAQRLETQRQAEEMVKQEMGMQATEQALQLAPLGDWRSGPQLRMDVRGSLQ